MPTLENTDPSILYCLFKGEWGTRKSTQALSFPKRQYWVSWEDKMNSLLLPMRKWGVNPADIEYDDFRDWDGPHKKLKELKSICPYKTIVIDSLTAGADLSLRQTRQVKSGATRKSGKAIHNIGGIEVNELEDFNAEAAMLQELVAITKEIKEYHGVNVILIGHVVQADYRNSQNNITHVSRQLVTAAKKVAAKIPGYCNEVYHFNIKKGMSTNEVGQYSLLTEHTGDDFARTCLDLDREIVFGDEQLYPKFLLPKINELVQGQNVIPIQKPVSF